MKTKKSNRIVLGILALLGFSAAGCDSVNTSPDMYGTPTTEYDIKGKVVDARTDEAIKDIRVVIEHKYDAPDTVYTDASGLFVFKKQIDGTNINNLKLIIEDYDGADNGEYVDKTEVIELDKSDYTRSSWVAKVSKTDIEVSLDPKPQ